MTREEAIRHLNTYSTTNGSGQTSQAQHEEAKRMGIKALEQEPRWIPVSESLPEENESVIASTELGVFPEARYSKKYGWEWAYEAGEDYWRGLGYEVEAWMPLPEPYEPQEDKE